MVVKKGTEEVDGVCRRVEDNGVIEPSEGEEAVDWPGPTSWRALSIISRTVSLEHWSSFLFTCPPRSELAIRGQGAKNLL